MKQFNLFLIFFLLISFSPFINANADFNKKSQMTKNNRAIQVDAAVQIISPDKSIPFSDGSQAVVVELSNISGNNLNSVSFQWFVNGVLQTNYNWTGDLVATEADTFTIGTFPFQSGILYEIQVHLSQPNGQADSNPANDMAILSDVTPALNGDYTLGGSQPDFQDFSHAAEILNEGGVLGAVNINIRSGFYYGQFTLEDINGTDTNKRVTFQAESGDSTDVFLQFQVPQSNNWVIRLLGSNYITFKNITIDANNDTNQGSLSAFFISNNSIGIHIEHCLILGSNIHPLNSVINFNSGTYPYFMLKNCRIKNGTYGVGLPNGNITHDILIENNVFENQSRGGLKLQKLKDSKITNNYITSAEKTDYQYYGIGVLNSEGGICITDNQIIDIPGKGIFLEYLIATSDNRVLIANNFIQVRNGISGVATPRPGYGIYAYASSNIEIFHNNVSVLDMLPDGYGLWGRYGAGYNIKNNIFSNPSGGYAVYMEWGNHIPSFFDFNDYHTTGPILGKWFNNDATDLAEWQTLSGQDANSLSVDPLYKSSVDLHVVQTQLNNVGTPILEVPTDIDGDFRDITTPDIGADEFNFIPDDVGIAFLKSPQNTCLLSNEEHITLTILNYSSTPLSGFDIGYILENNEPVIENIGNLVVPAGDTISFTFSNSEDLSSFGNYDFQAFTLFSNDNNLLNDTLLTTILNSNLPSSITNMLPTNGASDLDKSINFSWSPATDASLYDLYIWQAGTTIPSFPTVADIEGVSYTYFNNNLIYSETYHWQLIAKNDYCSTPSNQQNFSLRDLPDISVSNIQIPNTAFSGQEISISWEVANASGATGEETWYDVLYLSNNTSFDPNVDIYLGGIGNFSSLETNASYSNTASFTIPNGTTGDFYLLVHTDGFNNDLEEINDDNNLNNSATPISINLSPPPDLQVNSVIAPNNAFSGQTININWTTENHGTGITNHPEWSDQIWLSSDEILQYNNGQVSNATLLGTSIHEGHLDVNAAYSIFENIAIPVGISGDYFIHILTDVFNEVYEHTNADNNVNYAPITIFLTPPPDLVTTALQQPNEASNKETIDLTWTYTNQGGTEAGTHIDVIYLSQDPNQATFNHLHSIGSKVINQTLAINETQNSTSTGLIPNNINGQYYLHIIKDISNEVYENPHEDNNIFSQAITILSPDLEPLNITAPNTATSGSTFTFGWEDKNIGPGKLLRYRWQDRIYLSVNPIYQEGEGTLLYTSPVPHYEINLDVGEGEVHQFELNVPNGLFGQYYIHIVTDVHGSIFENGASANNITTHAIQLSLPDFPDLVGLDFQTENTGNAGEVTSISYTATNSGTAPTAVTWFDRLYISDSPSFQAETATLLEVVPRPAVLNVGEDYQHQLNPILPFNLETGTYYIHLLLDANAEVYEYNGESNNISSNMIDIIAYPPVNLAVVTAAAPSTAVSGENITIDWTIENQAAVSTYTSSWTDAIYLSEDTDLSIGTDILLGEKIRYGDLEGNNDSYTTSLTVALPPGLSGNYYCLILTDKTSKNIDSDLNNNVGVVEDVSNQPQPIAVTLSLFADLILENINAPNESNQAQVFDFIYTVKNVGDADIIHKHWTDKVFLSPDFNIDYNDYTIGTSSRVRTLLINESYTDTISVTLPPDVSGNQILIVKTDYSNVIYEHNQENNNINSAALLINIPPPSDLVVSDIDLPAMVTLGDSIKVHWTLQNQGNHPAAGSIKQAVYLSNDPIWDLEDDLLQTADATINLAPNATYMDSICVPVGAFTPGDYYALVRTDILNNIYEGNETNNTTASNTTMQIAVETLSLNTLTTNQLKNNQPVFYQLHIPESLAGESLLISLKGDSINGNNELYLRHELMPTRIQYDFQHESSQSGNQEIVVPALASGTYYIQVFGITSTDSAQDISLLASVLSFDIRNISPNVVGNGGYITLELEGAKFTDSMSLLLREPGFGVVYPNQITYVDATQAYVTYNLRGRTLGVYELLARNGIGDYDIVDSALTVELARPHDLDVEFITPPAARRGQDFKLKVLFSNKGNMDITGNSLLLSNLGNSFISLTEDGLLNESLDLEIPLEVIDGLPGVLPPGAIESISVFVKNNGGLGFTLEIPGFPQSN